MKKIIIFITNIWKEYKKVFFIFLVMAGVTIFLTILVSITVNKIKSDYNQEINSLNTQIVDLLNNNAELLTDAQKETERANEAEYERDAIKKQIENLKKQAPEPLKMPIWCLPGQAAPGDLDTKGIITYLCGQIKLRNDSIAFYINLNKENGKVIRLGDETIKILKIANHDYVQAIANFESMRMLEQEKFNLLLKKERKKKYKWGLGGFLLGAAVTFALK